VVNCAPADTHGMRPALRGLIAARLRSALPGYRWDRYPRPGRRRRHDAAAGPGIPRPGPRRHIVGPPRCAAQEFPVPPADAATAVTRQSGWPASPAPLTSPQVRPGRLPVVIRPASGRALRHAPARPHCRRAAQRPGHLTGNGPALPPPGHHARSLRPALGVSAASPGPVPDRMAAHGPLILPSRLLRHRHHHPPGAPGATSRLVHAGMNGEDLGQAGDGKNPQHLVLRRGEQQVTPGAVISRAQGMRNWRQGRRTRPRELREPCREGLSCGRLRRRWC
jgi:hypothetical protein